jgi:hypothetical protein
MLDHICLVFLIVFVLGIISVGHGCVMQSDNVKIEGMTEQQGPQIITINKTRSVFRNDIWQWLKNNSSAPKKN